MALNPGWARELWGPEPWSTRQGSLGRWAVNLVGGLSVKV